MHNNNLFKHIQFLISELDKKQKPTTMGNIVIESLFHIGPNGYTGTVSREQCIQYLRR